MLSVYINGTTRTVCKKILKLDIMSYEAFSVLTRHVTRILKRRVLSTVTLKCASQEGLFQLLSTIMSKINLQNGFTLTGPHRLGGRALRLAQARGPGAAAT